MTDPYIKLTKSTIETYTKTGKKISPPDDLPTEMLTTQAGVFVSIHRKDGSLRGCIGTFLPTKENIAQEIIANAISTAFSDPRFPPISEDELPDLVYSVDILSEPKKLTASRYTLSPKKFGLIVSTPDGRRGLLLPDIPGVDTLQQQIEICKMKAGIAPKETVSLQIFTVERHQEK